MSVHTYHIHNAAVCACSFFKNKLSKAKDRKEKLIPKQLRPTLKNQKKNRPKNEAPFWVVSQLLLLPSRPCHVGTLSADPQNMPRISKDWVWCFQRLHPNKWSLSFASPCCDRYEERAFPLHPRIHWYDSLLFESTFDLQTKIVHATSDFASQRLATCQATPVKDFSTNSMQAISTLACCTDL